ncbi:glycosyltransferase family 2 protein [Calditrichota bacterium]
MISFIIVTYNSVSTIEACLNSVFETGSSEQFEVIVIDNCSQDSTVSTIIGGFPDVKLIRGKSNIGFGSGVNRGVDEASGNYCFILNPDTILQTGCTDILRQKLEEDQSCGIVGPEIVDEGGRVIKSCFRFTNLFRSLLMAAGLHSFSRNQTKNLIGKSSSFDWINGAAIMVRKTELVNLGGFDENYFLYSEEEDLAIRLHKTGKTACVCPTARVCHVGAVSTDSQSVIAHASADWSRHYFLAKYYGWIVAAISKLAWVPALFVRAILMLILKQSVYDFKGYMASILSLLIPGYFQMKLRPPRD